MHLEVDPEILHDTAGGLRRCVEVAREFNHYRARLAEFVTDCGSHRLRDAAEHFVGRWGYGMGLVVGDAEHLAEQLESAAEQYRRLDADITRSAR